MGGVKKFKHYADIIGVSSLKRLPADMVNDTHISGRNGIMAKSLNRHGLCNDDMALESVLHAT